MNQCGGESELLLHAMAVVHDELPGLVMQTHQLEQFRGSRIAWANIEYRYLLNRDSRLFAFVDTGYFSRGEGEAKVDGAKLGYGFGLRIDTRLGFFGIDYGLGEGGGLSNGKVHISLRNAF